MTIVNKKIRVGLLYINNKKDKENGIDEFDIAGKLWGGYNMPYRGLSKNHKQYGYKDERKYNSSSTAVRK